jgi:hypothetical protein
MMTVSFVLFYFQRVRSAFFRLSASQILTIPRSGLFGTGIPSDAPIPAPCVIEDLPTFTATVRPQILADFRIGPGTESNPGPLNFNIDSQPTRLSDSVSGMKKMILRWVVDGIDATLGGRGVIDLLRPREWGLENVPCLLCSFLLRVLCGTSIYDGVYGGVQLR